MPSPPTHHDGSGELNFDIAKPAERVKFLGLLHPSKDSGRTFTGLFDWQCHTCGHVNRDAVMIELERGFLSRWLCDSCEEETVVRFRARSSADWITAHSLTVVDEALEYAGQDGSETGDADRRAGRPGSQRLLAWVAIPALIVLIALSLTDIPRLSNALAVTVTGDRRSFASKTLSRLRGYWTSQDGHQRIHFDRTESNSGSGTYMDCRQGKWLGTRFWFDVVDEDLQNQQLVIRLWEDRSTTSKSKVSLTAGVLRVTLHLDPQGNRLTWIEVEGDSPILKVYRRVEKL